jgi:hypothetical protein
VSVDDTYESTESSSSETGDAAAINDGDAWRRVHEVPRALISGDTRG